MQWYDIKEYEIPHDTYLIFRMKSEDGEINFSGGSFIGPKHGADKPVLQLDFDVCFMKHITHFCIPDVVKINKGE